MVEAIPQLLGQDLNVRLVNHVGVIARNDVNLHFFNSPRAPAQCRVRRRTLKLFTSLEQSDSTRVEMQFIVSRRLKVALEELDKTMSLGNLNVRRHQAGSLCQLQHMG